MTTKTVKKPKTTPKPTFSAPDLSAIAILFSTYYAKSGNTEVALQNSTHTLRLLRKVLENEQKS